jgi:hypothetical protein
MNEIRSCCTCGFRGQLSERLQFGGFSFRFGQFAALFLVTLLLGTGARGGAQTTHSPDEISVATVFPSNEIAELEPALRMSFATETVLPDAPEPQKDEPQKSVDPLKPMAAEPKTVTQTSSLPMAPMYSRVIPAGMATPQIHKWDKIELATRDLYSLSNVVDFVVSAGWSHVTNGQPNYGTDSGAFGQRVGAAAIRDSAQGFLSNGPFAVMLHQDPRYFALGNHYKFGKRVVYALTRPFVTRDSSDGHAVFNSSLILGQAAGVGLSNLFYPESNRNFHDNIARFGGSIGGSALSFGLDEFTSDLLRAVRLRRLERMMH